MPRASETIAAGVGQVMDDDAWAEPIAARLLAIYASGPGPANELRARRA
jgi:hypothetical protein